MHPGGNPFKKQNILQGLLSTFTCIIKHTAISVYNVPDIINVHVSINYYVHVKVTNSEMNFFICHMCIKLPYLHILLILFALFSSN